MGLLAWLGHFVKCMDTIKIMCSRILDLLLITVCMVLYIFGLKYRASFFSYIFFLSKIWNIDWSDHSTLLHCVKVYPRGFNNMTFVDVTLYCSAWQSNPLPMWFYQLLLNDSSSCRAPFAWMHSLFLTMSWFNDIMIWYYHITRPKRSTFQHFWNMLQV